MGAGVALFDYDNDGRLDIYFTNGARIQDPMPEGAMPEKSDPQYWNRLYHQNNDGTFEDVTERAGVQGKGYGMGVAAADYDNDGWTDIYVTAYGGNTLYHNLGNGTFRDVTKQCGVEGSGWSASAGWFDANRDGRLDLFVTRYLEWDFLRGSIYCGEKRPGYRSYCHPDSFLGVTNLLFVQQSDGSFKEVSREAKVADSAGKGLGVAFADFDGDGWTDVVVANDSVRQSLYINKKDGTFEEIALLAGVGYDENGKTFAGMGVDAADYDNDGRPDVFITDLSNQTYALFRNNGDLTFTYATNSTGVGQITLLYSGWGTRFVDLDNDGLLDIFVSQGHVMDTIEKTSGHITYRETPLLMRNAGEEFVNVSASAGAPFSVPLAARGAAFGDIDNDGDIDVVLAVTGGNPAVLRNNGTRNHWLGLTLAGLGSNRNGLGARITVTAAGGAKRIFDVTQAGSYLSSNDPRVLIGLGSRDSVSSVEVRWPSGKVQRVAKPEPDRYQTVREP